MDSVNLVSELNSTLNALASTIVELFAVLQRVQSSLDPTTPVIELRIRSAGSHQVNLSVTPFGSLPLLLTKCSG